MGFIWPWSNDVTIENGQHESECNAYFAIEHILRFGYVTEETDLNLEVQKFWDFDNIGIRDTDTLEEQFERSTIVKDGKYSVNLPFRDGHPTLLNKYDNIASRGRSAKLCSSLAWWEGPDWLRLPQDYWPQQPVLNEPTEDRLTEMKSLETKALLCVESDNEVALEGIVAAYLLQTCETLRITALVVRFVENLKKMMNIENRELEQDELASDEVEKVIRGKDGPDRPDGPDGPDVYLIDPIDLDEMQLVMQT